MNDSRVLLSSTSAMLEASELEIVSSRGDSLMKKIPLVELHEAANSMKACTDTRALTACLRGNEVLSICHALISTSTIPLFTPWHVNFSVI